MIRYTVTYSRSAHEDLSQLWLDTSDRARVAEAANEIDGLLATEPSEKGAHVSEGLRRLVIGPLVVQFSVEEEDRMVTVWSARETDE